MNDLTLLIDNYDSFTYNLYQMLGEINPNIFVARNDALTIADIEKLSPARIIISPGPGYPKDAGISEAVIRHFAPRLPILGVCLGHQAICEVYGATISHAKSLMHGKPSEMKLDNDCYLFKGLPEIIIGARYHSLAAVHETMPACLKITALTDDEEIMAVAHIEHALFGVQFHPESILTPLGHVILKNFMELE